ncbi:CBS domain-containing protein [Sulfolobus sp. E5-1-F]|uniref:CBS domain-containing protein n=1 Tax=Sulfolobaceae TaxID=118883 RepID=UPI00129689A7|nr:MULTISPECIES: CBS domain-containing protein [unclassified Sulfolobus]QGA55199.1 CBS domain-containing protein [Sulfolobus sp. E5-1-F]QGA67995.1 CBS domain-containing protein [Sulfolobus sp. E11-6]
MNIETLMIRNPPILSKEDRLGLAFKKINEGGIGRIIISNEKIEGLLTTRDLLSTVESHCKDSCSQGDLYRISTTPVIDYMTPNPVTIYNTTDEFTALNIMVTRNFGSLPVVDINDKPVGIITEREFLLLYKDLDEIFPVKVFMTTNVRTIYKDVRLDQAVRLMLRRGFRRLPVINDDNKVIGIITVVNAIRQLAKAVDKLDPDYFYNKAVKDIMVTNLVTIDELSSINRAAAEMIVKRIGSLLILNKDNTIRGIITERDLLIALHHILVMEKFKEKL